MCSLALLAAGVHAPGKDISDAVSEGDLEKVQLLIREQPGVVNALDGAGNTPLHYAAQQTEPALVELLIAHGANVNMRGQDSLGFWCGWPKGGVAEETMEGVKKARGVTALHWAAWGSEPDRQAGHREVMGVLIGHGAEVNAQDANGLTPLHWAVRRAQTQLAEFLLANGADVLAKNFNGDTALHMAAYSDRAELVKLLLAKGADVDARDKRGATALHSVTERAFAAGPESVRLLLAAGANPNVADRDGWTPLFDAAYGGNERIVKSLLAAGARMDLFAAVAAGRTGTVRQLLAEKPELVNARRGNDRCLLDIAIEKENRRMADLLIAKGADVTVFAAASLGQITRLQALL